MTATATLGTEKHFYSAPGLAANSTGAGDRVLVRCLAMVEGSQTDARGKQLSFTPEKLQQIAIASNDLIRSGIDVPFFKDHLYSQDSKIGLVVGPYSCAPITEADLPRTGLEDLLGKYGVFTYVEILGSDNVQLYQQRRIKPVSVGFDFKGGVTGKPLAIFEISAVPFPAIRGASLFALDLNGQLAESAQEEEIHAVVEAFKEVIESINEASPEQLAGRTKDELKQQAIADLSAGLSVRLNMPTSATQPLPTVPISGMQMSTFSLDISRYSEDEQEQFKAHVAAFKPAVPESPEIIQMKAQLTQLTAERDVTTKYSVQKHKADQLNANGQMPASVYNFLFDLPQDELVLVYSATLEKDPVDLVLEAFEKMPKIANFGSMVGGLPVGKSPVRGTQEEEAAEAEAAEFSKVYTPKVSYK